MDEGTNSGVTGVINLPGQGAKFSVWARAHTTELTAALMDAAGRGDSEWPEQRPLSSGGFVSVGGSVSLDGWPTPDKFRGELGTLTLQQQTGVTLTLPVRVREITLKKSSKEQGLWDVTAVCQIVGDPASAGFAGSQPVAATETFDDKALWAGMTKTVDPQGLQSAAAARMLVWGIGDSDAAEKTKIDDVLGAMSAPFSGMKIRAGAFQRLSKNACLVDVSFGLTNTAEDVVNPQTATTLDANHLASAATAAAINATPDTPAGDSFVLRTETTQELNDAKTLHRAEFGLRDTSEDVTMPATYTRPDVSHLEDDAVVCLQTGSSTVPATPAAPVGQLLGTRSEQLNRVEWKHEFAYGNTTPLQKILFADAPAAVDPDSLEDEKVLTQTTSSSTEGTPPATPSGLKLRRKTSTRLAGTPELWEWRYQYARTTSAEDVENGGTVTTDEQTGLAQTARVTLVRSTSTQPSTPSAPVGQFVEYERQELNDGAFRHTFRYANTTEQQRVEFDGTEDQVDAFALTGEPTETQVTSSSTPPTTPVKSGYVLRLYRARRIGGTPEKWRHTWQYGRRTTEQDVLFPKTSTQADAAALDQEQLIPVLYASGGSPVAPSTPSGMVLFDTVDTPETDGYLVRVYRYRYVTRQTEAERGRYEYAVDPNALRTTMTTAAVWDSAGAAPSTPAAPADTKLVEYRDVGLPSHPTKVARVYRWGPTDSIDDVTLPESYTFTDPQGLASRGAAALVDGLPSVPGGFKSRGKRTRFLNTVNEDVLNVVEFGLTDTKDDIEFAGHLLTDVSGQVDADTVVTVTSGASWSPPTNSGSLVLRDYDRRQHVPGVYVFNSSYGLWTRDDEMIARASRTQAPAARGRVDLDAVLASGTAAASVNLGGTWTASINPTASIETAAEAVRTALLGDASFEAVDVERVTPSKLLLNLHRRGTRWWMELESRTFSGLLAPWRLISGGVVQVFVADVVKITSSLWAYVIGEVPAACTLMDFTIWKTYTGDSLYTNTNAAGLTNADIFMGFAALTVTYAGVTGPVAIKDSYRYPSASNISAVAFEGARTQGWKFRYDSRGIVAADGICPGYVAYTTTDLSGVDPRTWVDASTLGVTAASATPLDFTQAFLNTTP